MKKLELKHLAPYLPYKLKFMECNYDTDQMLSGIDTYIIANWSEPYQYKDGENIVYSFYDYSSMWSISEIKPIFRPLSDLTKEIEINCEKFVPIIKLADIADCDISDINYKLYNNLEMYGVMFNIENDEDGYTHEVFAYDPYNTFGKHVRKGSQDFMGKIKHVPN